MTELEQQLLKALEQMQNEQQTQQNALRQMFESTKQDNQALRQSLAVFLDGLTETDKNRNENLNKLARQISSLNKQVQGFNEQTATLSKQIQVLEQQVLKLKKWMNLNAVTAVDLVLVGKTKHGISQC